MDGCGYLSVNAAKRAQDAQCTNEECGYSLISVADVAVRRAVTHPSSIKSQQRALYLPARCLAAKCRRSPVGKTSEVPGMYRKASPTRFSSGSLLQEGCDVDHILAMLPCPRLVRPKVSPHIDTLDLSKKNLIVKLLLRTEGAQQNRAGGPSTQQYIWTTTASDSDSMFADALAFKRQHPQSPILFIQRYSPTTPRSLIEGWGRAVHLYRAMVGHGLDCMCRKSGSPH